MCVCVCVRVCKRAHSYLKSGDWEWWGRSRKVGKGRRENFQRQKKGERKQRPLFKLSVWVISSLAAFGLEAFHCHSHFKL